MPPKPAVFLDRDNTLIVNGGDLGDPEQVVLMQGVAMAVASLVGLGFKVVVVSNQGGVARGKYGEGDVKAVNERTAELIAKGATGARIDAFYYCPYHPKGTVKRYAKEHPTRKPQPGMLTQAAEEMGLDLSRSWMVGDALRDVAAGAAAGCRTVLLHGDADRVTPAQVAERGDSTTPGGADAPVPDYVARTLVEAVRIIASERHTVHEQREKGDVPAAAVVAAAGPGKRFDAATMARLQKPRPKKEPVREADAPGESADASADASPPEPAPPPRAGSRTSKPFRPMTLPPEPAEGETTSDRPHTPPSGELFRAVRERVVGKLERVWAEREQHGEADAPASPTPLAKQEIAEATRSALRAVRADEERAAPRADEEPAGANEPIPANGEANRTLRLILQELRAQRGGGDDASPATLVALVLQTVAIVCVVGGLWMGRGDDGLFFRWMGVALIAQLMVVALSLRKR